MTKRPPHGMAPSQPHPACSFFREIRAVVLGCLLLWTIAAPLGREGGRAVAQESNQACLLSLEKTAQSQLLEPRYSALSFPPEPLAGSRQRSVSDQAVIEPSAQKAPSDIPRTRLTIAWGYYNQGDYEKALALFEASAPKETPADVAEESRLGAAYALLRLNRLPEAARLLEELVSQGIRPKETVPALVEVLLALKRYEDAEKYLPLLP